jgi:hypothetical protein
MGEVQQFVQGLADLKNSAKKIVSAVSMHAPPLYSRALYNNFPTNLKGKIPDPPTK